MLKIQSLSIAVPAGCGNRCKYGVCYMHRNKYANQIENNARYFDIYEKDYINRMAYARDNGCNSVMLTGDGEPLLNRDFLKLFSHWNRLLAKPFRQIELQTSGQTLDDEYLYFLRSTVGVSVISLSVSALDSTENRNYNNPISEQYWVDIAHLSSEIKRHDFTLRLSLNLTDWFNNVPVTDIFSTSKALGANQLLFRVLYEDGGDSEEERWVQNHSCAPTKISEIREFIAVKGRALNRLPFGAIKYSVEGISCVLDEDCMHREVTEDLKYLVLQPDCKLYSHWSDVGSLVF